MDSSTCTHKDKISIKAGVVPASASDVLYVAERLREADLQELYAMHGKDVDVPMLLLQSWKESIQRYTIIANDEPVGIFGLAEVAPKLGAPWLVGTDGLPKIAKSFITGCPHYVERMLDTYPNLVNYVHKDNRLAIRWLKYLGFTFLPIMTNNFYPFIKIKRYA